MRNFTREWLKASVDDLRVIKNIINDECLTHIVAFHAQQSVEKSLKAIIEEYEIDIPKIHKLVKLNQTVIEKFEQLDKNMLKTLDELYIDSRYPGDMGLLPYGKPTIEDSEEFYRFAKEVFKKVCRLLDIGDEFSIFIDK